VIYNIKNVNKRIKVIKEYENITEKLLLGGAVLAAFMSGRKCDVIPQNGDCSRENKGSTWLSKGNVVTEPASDKAIRRWLKQFQEMVVFCAENERKDRALRRKMLIGLDI
jgi:3-phosphoglycerate kinase